MTFVTVTKLVNSFISYNSYCMIGWFGGAEYFAFSTGRAGEAFSGESDLVEEAADDAFGTVGCENAT